MRTEKEIKNEIRRIDRLIAEHDSLIGDSCNGISDLAKRAVTLEWVLKQ